MKSFLCLAIAASLLASHSAMAAKCSIISIDSKLSYYAQEMGSGAAALGRIGYDFDKFKVVSHAFPENSKKSPANLNLHIKLTETEKFNIGCKRTIEIYDTTPDGKPSQVVYSKTATVFGQKNFSMNDPCPRALKELWSAVPSCLEMTKKVGKSQDQEAVESQPISNRSPAPARAAVGAQ